MPFLTHAFNAHHHISLLTYIYSAASCLAVRLWHPDEDDEDEEEGQRAEGDEGPPFKTAYLSALMEGLMTAYVKSEPGVKVEEKESRGGVASQEPHQPFHLDLQEEGAWKSLIIRLFER